MFERALELVQFIKIADGGNIYVILTNGISLRFTLLFRGVPTAFSLYTDS